MTPQEGRHSLVHERGRLGRACRAMLLACLGTLVLATAPTAADDERHGAGRGEARGEAVVVFGPRVYERSGEAPEVFRGGITLPAGVSGPWHLRLQVGEAGQRSGRGRREHDVANGSLRLDGIEVVGPNEFGNGNRLIEKHVELRPDSHFELRLAGRPGGRVTLSFVGRRPPSIPVAIAPERLRLAVGAAGEFRVSLAPPPVAAGRLSLRSEAPRVASVPAAVAFAAGQTEVAVPVDARTAGRADIHARLNDRSVEGRVQVSRQPISITRLSPTSLDLVGGSSGTLVVELSAASRRSVSVRLAAADPAIAGVAPGVLVPAGSNRAEFAVAARGPGSTPITARLGDSTASSQIRVLPGTVQVVSLLPVSSTLTLGASGELRVGLSSVQPTPSTILLGAVPQGIVELPHQIIVPAGQSGATMPITALALGTAAISASLNGSSVGAAVRVMPPAPALTSLSPPLLTLRRDAGASLSVSLNAAQLTPTDIAVAADDPAKVLVPATVVVPAGETVATIPVTALTLGETLVSAGLAGAPGLSARVVVIPEAPLPVSLQPDPLPLQVGAAGQMTLTINAAQLEDTAVSVVNSAPALLQAPAQIVVPAGAGSVPLPVTALAAGEGRLTVGIGSATLGAGFIVTLPPPAVANLGPATLSLPKGVPGRLSLTLSRTAAEPVAVTLSSSAPGIVEVASAVTLAAGTLSAEFPVIARGEGTANISASLNGGSASVPVTVTPPELVTLTLSPQAPLAYVGETVAFLAQGSFTDASMQEVGSRASWSSDRPEVAGIDAAGVASALAPGTATIAARLGGVGASTPLSVESVPLLSLTPATGTLKVDATLTLNVSSSQPAVEDLAVVIAVTGSGGVSAPVAVVIPAGQSAADFSLVGRSPGPVLVSVSAARRMPASAAYTVVPKLAIHGVNPPTAPAGSPVTLSGEGFDPNPANNEVRFNGERAVVASATPTALQVVVPVRASSGPLSLTTPLGTVFAAQAFNVPAQQDFDLALLPAAIAVPPGADGATRVRLVGTGLTPYAHAANLSVAGLPPGVSARFERPTVFAGGDSGLQLSVPAGLAAGRYVLEIIAVGNADTGPQTRRQTLTLDVLPAGSTSVSGRVLHAEDDRPFVGARIRLGGQEAFTDASGYYRFLAPSVSGDQVLLIDGSAADSETVRYAGAIALPVTILAARDNPVLTSYISAVDPARSVSVTPGVQTAVTLPDLPDYALNIPAGATLFGWDGTPVTQISVRTIPVDRLPIKPLPPGVETRSVYLYYFFREGGANPTQPIPVTMSNDLDALPGEPVEMWYYDESATPDPASNQWRVMGTATISADGKSAVSDPGVGIPKFCCGATFFRRLPASVANAQTGPGGGDGGDGGLAAALTAMIDDVPPKPGLEQPKTCAPVDLASGNNIPFEHRGFGIRSLLPVNIDCQYRSTDPRIGPFGRGTSFVYDWSAAVVGDAVIVATPDGVKYSLPREGDGVYRTRSGKSAALGWEVRPTAAGRTLRLPRGAEMDFNPAGNLIALRDHEGRTVRLTLDASGFPTTITDASGRGYVIGTQTVNINRVIYRLITGVTDALGRSVGFAYDPNGRLLTHTDAGGNVTRYDYDTNNRVSRRTRPDGGAISFQYDGSGRTIKETLEDGTSTLGYAYTTVGNLVTGTTVTDPRGNPTNYRFNGQGYVTRITDALGRVTSQSLDPATHLVQSITDPAGRTTRYTYDPKGKVTAVTDPNGNVTRIEYDPLWNKPTKITDALGNFSTIRYDERGRPVESTDPLGAIRRSAFNVRGLPETLTDPLGRSVTLGYDDEGNLASATDPLGNTSRRRYDSANRLIESSDPLGHSQSLAYDPLDRVSQATDANGGVSVFDYDSLDRLRSLTDPRGNPVERRAYDLRGRLIRRTDAANLSTTYDYDPAGNLIKITDRKGQITTLGYDALNRATEVIDADGRVTRTEYDLAGNVAALRDSVSGDLLFSYDLLDRPIRVISDQGSVETRYDALGRRTQRTINGSDPVDYHYDTNSRLIRIDYRGKSTTYDHDLAGRLLKKTLPNGSGEAYAYDDADRVTEIRLLKPDGSLLDTIAYDYDAAGRRTKRAAPMASVAETPLTASYDASNRLSSLTLNGASVSLAYDANGNLRSKTAANGDTTTYTWDAGNRLIGIDGRDPQGRPLIARFRYDAVGRRIERTINGDSVQFLYDGQQAIAEIRGSAISATLLTSLQIDEALARYSALGERSLLSDALGSVVIAGAEDGAVQTAYGYSPYGQTESLGAEEGSSSQYTGRENDGTGIYYYRARYYDPVLKRFLSEDPIGIRGGENIYSYVNGNPVSLSDPAGLAPAFYFPTPANLLQHLPTAVQNQLVNMAVRVNAVQVAELANAALAQYGAVAEINYMVAMAARASAVGGAFATGVAFGTWLNDNTALGRSGEYMYDLLHPEQSNQKIPRRRECR